MFEVPGGFSVNESHHPDTATGAGGTRFRYFRPIAVVRIPGREGLLLSCYA